MLIARDYQESSRIETVRELNAGRKKIRSVGRSATSAGMNNSIGRADNPPPSTAPRSACKSLCREPQQSQAEIDPQSPPFSKFFSGISQRMQNSLPLHRIAIWRRRLLMPCADENSCPSDISDWLVQFIENGCRAISNRAGLRCVQPSDARSQPLSSPSQSPTKQF